ncbi:MAG: DUF2993 domain-containing protein [Actinobacteria bacterium]|nr:DUF2993 domain-containing protein [Actinomycetota bacterium]
MRIIRRLVVTVVVLGVLGVLANVFIVQAAEQKAGDEIRSHLHLAKAPDVKIEGFPILLHVLQGNIPKVTIDGNQADIQGLLIANFHVELRAMRAKLAELRAGISKLRVGGGTASATVTQAAANDYLKNQKEEGRVTFGNGVTRIQKHVTYLGRSRLVAASGKLLIDGADLVFRATKVTIDGKTPPPPFADRARRDASFRVHLPAIPGGIRPQKVEVLSGLLRFTSEFDASTISLG